MKEKRSLKKIIGATILTCSFLPIFTNAQEIQGTISSPIKLTEDTILTKDVILENKAKLMIESGEVTIDLNGFEIIQTKDQYAIDSTGGIVTIKNGTVKCVSETASCIRNYKEMTLDNVTVNSMYSGLKNEEGTIATIKNSALSANGEGGAIQNFGKTYIENSTLKNSSPLYSTAILAGSYDTYDAEVYAKNCIFDAMEAVQTVRHPASPAGSTCENKITFEGGKLLQYGMIRLDDPNSKATVKGTIEGPVSLLEYAEEGSRVILTENVDRENLTIPKEVSLRIPENISFNVKNMEGEGQIECPENKVIKEREDGSITMLDKADYTKLLEILAEVEKLDDTLYTEESVDKVNEILQEITEPKSVEEQDEVDEITIKLEEAVKNLELKENNKKEETNDKEEQKPDVTVEENPKTIDNIVFYLIVSLTCIGTLILSVKKCLN